MRGMSGKIIQEKNKNQVKPKTQCILNTGFASQPNHNMTSHRDIAEGLEGYCPAEMEVKHCGLRSDVIFDVLVISGQGFVERWYLSL